MSRRTTLIALIALFSLGLVSVHPAFSENSKSSVSTNPENPAPPPEEVVDTKPFIPSRNQSWMLFIAIIGASSAFAFNQASAWVERWKDRKERAEALMVAFRGEVNSIRTLLRGTLKPSWEMFEKGQTLKIETRSFPMTIFKANAGRLGEIRDVNLVRYLANLYSLLEQTNEFARRFEGWESPSEPFFEFYSTLINSFHASVLLDLKLREETKHLIITERTFTLSEDEADDRNFCLRIQQRLDELRETRENRQ